jgi:hypothetical protein
MKKYWGSKIWATVLPLAFATTLTGTAHAQAPRTIYLYNAALGRAPSVINAAKSGPWGNGTVSNARRVDYEGAPVLQLTTRNFQEGVRFDLTTPVDLAPYTATGFLRFRLRFNEGGFGGGFGGGGFGGGRGGGRGGFGGGGGFPGGGGGGGGFNFLLKPRWDSNAQFGGALPPLGGFPAQGVPFNPGNGEGAPTAPPQRTSITELSVTMLRDTGATSGSIPVNLNNTTADENGWRLFVLPIRQMTSTPGASGPVRRIIITSDNEDNFYMAQAAIVVENGQMTASIRRPEDAAGAQVAEIEVKPGPITLIADVEAGAADPAVEWNFDADNVGNLPPAAISDPAGAAAAAAGGGAPNFAPGGIPGRPGGPGVPGQIPDAGAEGGAAVPVGPRIDARGLTATFEYPNEEQNYRVEVTVRDRSGQKQPVTTSILVRVRG